MCITFLKLLKFKTTCTHYAIIQQVKLARTVSYEISASDQETTVITFEKKTHDVSQENGSCSCAFSRTLLMPCRHNFFARIQNGLEVIDCSLVAERWLKSYQVHVRECENMMTKSDVQPSEVTMSCIKAIPSLSSTLSKNQKHRKILSLSQKLAVLASNCGMPDFRQKYSDIENLISFWENNVSFAIIPTSDTSCHMFKQVIRALCA